MECIVNEHGIAQVPGLHSIPDFNLEQELAAASEFLVEPAAPSKPRQVTREELTSMASASPAAAAAAEHEEE
jgi:hypothetical protein